ncbi:Ferric-uptake regulator, partial [gut metagenome]
MEPAAKQFKKRNAILQCLRQTHAHPSAEMVYDLLQQEHPDISLATVYRNLARFKSQGLIQSLGTVNGVERFDADT